MDKYTVIEVYTIPNSKLYIVTNFDGLTARLNRKVLKQKILNEDIKVKGMKIIKNGNQIVTSGLHNKVKKAQRKH